MFIDAHVMQVFPWTAHMTRDSPGDPYRRPARPQDPCGNRTYGNHASDGRSRHTEPEPGS